MRTLPLLVLSCLLAAVLGAAALAEDAPKAVPKKEGAAVTLKDLAWMVGSWSEASGPSIFSETWMPAQGDAMTGAVHWTIQGKTRMYELTVIEQTPKGLVIHVRHFNPGLVPWAAEAKGPVTWPLKELRGQHVIFEHPTRAWPKRLEYKRDGDVMSGRLSGVENGKPNVLPFTFRLRK